MAGVGAAPSISWHTEILDREKAFWHSWQENLSWFGKGTFQVSLITYYAGILARGKPGSPTREEARRDFLAVLDARLIPIYYV